MSSWQVLSGTDPSAAACFADLDTVFALDGDIVAADSMTRTLRIDVAGRRYYVKRYAGLGKKPLRRWLATPRVQLEWENLQHFADWGIPTAQVVACGLESRAGRFLRGALITAEIPGTTDLGHIARTGDPRLKSRRWQDGILSQVAEIARLLHDKRFVHGDLKWRNLLVDDHDKVYLIDCPSGSFWWPPFLEYRIVKDLACLDKLAKLHLSRTQRLRFYLRYAQQKKLDDADKHRLRRIVAFFTGRDEALASAASLRAGGRNVLPGTLALDDSQLLTIERWLRILPGKRLTGLGTWQGRRVLAKLFIAARGSERHWQRERDGATTLADHGFLTPATLAAGTLAEGGHYVLYEYLDDARSPVAGSPGELEQVFAQVGHMHARGVLQEDAHLANFLIAQQRLYVIDGDAIRTARTSGDWNKNLALLFAQLPPDTVTTWQDALLAAYRSGHPAADIDELHLAAEIAQARAARLDDLLDKCVRDCSLFKSARRIDRFFSMVRTETGLLAPLIHDPDAWLEKGTALKRGRTATLARIEVTGTPLVIKRYNIKGPGHALSRCWRPSRAWHSWIAAHRLQFFGIATPRPLALVEQRYGPLRGRAWLVSEYCPGGSLATLLADGGDVPEDIIAAVGRVFCQLAEARITHGDLKATNLLWHDGMIFLIDLDATRQHANASSFSKAWRRDRERFLKNWPENSALRLALDQALPGP
jgi:tRNA A-37 threonylcarbamoyl transferase component Bud32